MACTRTHKGMCHHHHHPAWRAPEPTKVCATFIITLHGVHQNPQRYVPPSSSVCRACTRTRKCGRNPQRYVPPSSSDCRGGTRTHKGMCHHHHHQPAGCAPEPASVEGTHKGMCHHHHQTAGGALEPTKVCATIIINERIHKDAGARPIVRRAITLIQP
jgi:hypothetical protein